MEAVIIMIPNFSGSHSKSDSYKHIPANNCNILFVIPITANSAFQITAKLQPETIHACTYTEKGFPVLSFDSCNFRFIY